MLLEMLNKMGRKRIVYDRYKKEPYLERYYLFLKERKRFPFNIFLHKFLKGDSDDLHDHPWSYFTLVLKGGYIEHTPKGTFWRSPGHFRICTANSYHRIELKPDVYCWTLFIPGRKQKEWGFLDNGNWVQSDVYLKEKYNVV